MTDIEIIADGGRRRRGRSAKKLGIVEETLDGTVSMPAVARRNGGAPNLLYRWGKVMRERGGVGVTGETGPDQPSRCEARQEKEVYLQKQVDAIDFALGQKVRKLRQRAGIRQQDLAPRIGVRFQQLQKYEQGTNRISASRLWKIAECLDVPIQELFADVETNQSAPVPPTRKADALVRAYLLLPDSQQAAVLKLVEEIARPSSSVEEKASKATAPDMSDST